MLFIFGSWVFQAIASKRKQREEEEPYPYPTASDPNQQEAEETAFDTLQRQLREIGMELEESRPEPPPSAETPPPPPYPPQAPRPVVVPPPPPPRVVREPEVASTRPPQGRPGHGDHAHPPLHQAVPGSVGSGTLLEAAPTLLDAGRPTPPLPTPGSRLFSALRPKPGAVARPTGLARKVIGDLRGGPAKLSRAILLKEILGPPVALQGKRDLPE
jgi:hypothetical protein